MVRLLYMAISQALQNKNRAQVKLISSHETVFFSPKITIHWVGWILTNCHFPYLINSWILAILNRTALLVVQVRDLGEILLISLYFNSYSKPVMRTGNSLSQAGSESIFKALNIAHIISNWPSDSTVHTAMNRVSSLKHKPDHPTCMLEISQWLLSALNTKTRQSNPCWPL